MKVKENVLSINGLIRDGFLSKPIEFLNKVKISKDSEIITNTASFALGYMCNALFNYDIVENDNSKKEHRYKKIEKLVELCTGDNPEYANLRENIKYLLETNPYEVLSDAFSLYMWHEEELEDAIEHFENFTKALSQLLSHNNAVILNVIALAFIDDELEKEYEETDEIMKEVEEITKDEE